MKNLLSFFLLAFLFSGFSAPVELLKNGGFEEVSGTLPVGWSKPGKEAPGTVSLITEDAHYGKYSLRFDGEPTSQGFCFYSCTRNAYDVSLPRPGVPVDYGGTYEISCFARGKGRISFLLPCSTKTTFLRSIFSPVWELNGEWRKFTFQFKITDPKIASVLPSISIHGGKHSFVEVDQVSLTFDPVKNPGIQPFYLKKMPEKSMTMTSETRDAVVKTVLLNGKMISTHSGAIPLKLREGINILEVECQSTGGNPGVKFDFPVDRQLNSRWKAGSFRNEKTGTMEFDDTNWWIPENEKGYFWSRKAEKNGVVAFRQMILWNEKHTGSNRCIVPQVSEWGFPQNFMELLPLAIYSPLNRNQKDYTFVLEIPEEFQMLEMKPDGTRSLPVAPKSVSQKKTVRDGRNYIQYTIVFPQQYALANATKYQFIPLALKQQFAPGTSLNFYFRRLADGNFTEMEQILPVKIMAPVNGKQPENLVMEEYVAFVGGFPLEVELNTIRQAAQIGLNWIFTQHTNLGIDAIHDFHQKRFAEFDRNKINRMVWAEMNFPFYGMVCYGMNSVPQRIYSWLRSTPEAQARYFKDNPKWDSKIEWTQFCPTYMLDNPAGQYDFKRYLKTVYRMAILQNPGSKGIFIDWEQDPWLTRDNIPGKGSWCFCNKCKAAFAKNIGFKGSIAELTDDRINDQYHTEWNAFRRKTEARIHGVIQTIMKELGVRHCFYFQLHYKDLLENLEDVDLMFIGCPATAEANRDYQKNMDQFLTSARRLWPPRKIVGQLFPVSGYSTEKNGWENVIAYSPDGMLHPWKMKTQALRIVAAFRAGLDLQNTVQLTGGGAWYMGEATRLLADQEDLFLNGTRKDHRIQGDIAYPDALVLEKGNKRLILLFNESDSPRKVSFSNLELPAKATARLYYQNRKLDSAEKVSFEIPARDVEALLIEGK